MKARGIDVIDCSAGGMSGSVSLGTSKIRPGYQVDLAAAVRRGADIPTMAVGAIIEPRQAEAILVDGDADLVALGRQMMAEPHWLYRAAQELGLANPARRAAAKLRLLSGAPGRGSGTVSGAAILT